MQGMTSFLPSYGALSDNLPDCLTDDAHKFFLSTAIAYTNGYPHIGHAYEFLTADAIGKKLIDQPYQFV